MSAIEALFWGGFTSASLYVGQLLARPMEKRIRATGLIMGFGAGTMLSAVAYELVPESSLEEGWGVAAALLVGTLTYFFLDRLVDQGGGEKRQDIAGETDTGSGSAMFLGALLDGIPEAFVLGITLAFGGGVNIAFVAAVFISNIPQGIAGTNSLKASGRPERSIFWMWTGLTATCAITSVFGFVLADKVPEQGIYAQAFAAGAVLTMLADSMMPEAFEHGGKLVGIVTVLGFLLAAGLTLLQ